MTPDSKPGILRRVWVFLNPLRKRIIRAVKEMKPSVLVEKIEELGRILFKNPFVLSAGIATPFAGTTVVQYNIENYQLHLASVNLQLYELKEQQDELLEIVLWIKNMKNFQIDPILFPKARTKQRATLENGNYESVLDSDPGAGIGLLDSQKEQLNRLARSVAILDDPSTIELKVEGFSSTLPFLNSPCKSESKECNKAAANLRAKQVCDYLESKLPGPRFHIEARTWKDYEEMDQNRYYPYVQSTPSKSIPGLHVLNQAVHITISSP